MAIIKDLDGVPPWFNRENYAAAEGFNAAQWYEQLNRRRKLLEPFDYQLDRTHLLNEDGSPSYELNLWRLSWASDELASIRKSPVTMPISAAAAITSGFPIKSIRTLDLMKQMDRDAVAVREGLCGEDKLRRWSVIADDEAYYGLNEEIAVQPLTIDFYGRDRKPSAVVQVDLEATNKVLIAAFEVWLNESRASQRSDNKKGQNERNNTLYQNWARFGLLPYLDLKIWTMETGNQIQIQTLKEAIAKFRISESNFAKSTIGVANRLMADLTQIRALAAVEEAKIG